MKLTIKQKKREEMKKILTVLMLSPMLLAADFCVHCPSCETVVSISDPVRTWYDGDDEGVTWTCRVCKYSNWKQYPPYNCGHCGTAMGKG